MSNGDPSADGAVLSSTDVVVYYVGRRFSPFLQRLLQVGVLLGKRENVKILPLSLPLFSVSLTAFFKNYVFRSKYVIRENIEDLGVLMFWLRHKLD